MFITNINETSRNFHTLQRDVIIEKTFRELKTFTYFYKKNSYL